MYFNIKCMKEDHLYSMGATKCNEYSMGMGPCKEMVQWNNAHNFGSLE